ncbi:glycosyltransferase [Faecalibacter bovis]|uniref:Glycosyltransferase n=1 Tax=Faecalibacter bovis TaxID=2898187 RepID=A0ABX7XE87_9FLAO|nr:glycosyltransferase [Faecalibacter bovis]QTV06173.1 glycosyltransferase [Faecalibacter bovis]
MKVISAVINNIETDQRVDKVCNSLLKFGYDVELIGTTLRGKPTLNKEYKTSLIPMKYQVGFKSYAEFNFKLFVNLLIKADKNCILLANDLDSLLPFYLVSKIKKLPLVFDSHEIYSELPSLHNRPTTKKIWKSLERFLLPRVKYFYTVSNGYANWFKKEYGSNPEVIRNVPHLQKLNDTENLIFFKLPQVPENHKIVLYQGALNMSRGLEYMIEAMLYVENCVFWIAGDGPKRNELEKLVQDFKLDHKIFFLGNVPPKILKTITPLAEVGISLEQDLGISYKYALPNKVFDYFQAKVPILSTYLPEIKATIEHYDAGRVITKHDAKHIAEELNILLKEGKKSYHERLSKAAQECCWENEEPKLKAIFEQIKKVD